MLFFLWKQRWKRFYAPAPILQVQNKVEAGSSLHDSLIETTGPEKTILVRMYRITCHKLNPVISWDWCNLSISKKWKKIELSVLTFAPWSKSSTDFHHVPLISICKIEWENATFMIYVLYNHWMREKIPILTVLGLGSLFSSVPANGNQVQEEVAGLYFY